MGSKSTEPERTDKRPEDSFAEMAREKQPGFFREFASFLRYNRKWWLTPILIVLALLIVLVVVSQTPLAPFIYPFF